MIKIIDFSFENFKSFKELQTINMVKKGDGLFEEVDHHNVIACDPPLLKSKAIFGPNASGKSNVIKAFVHFLGIIRYSLSKIGLSSFALSEDTIDQPTYFNMTFWVDDNKYYYGFVANEKKIIEEWLYAVANDAEVPYFERKDLEIEVLNTEEFVDGKKLFKLIEGDLSEIDLFTSDTLFLSALAKFGFSDVCRSIVNELSWINVISGLRDASNLKTAKKWIFTDQNVKDFTLQLLQKSDTGIKDIYFEEMNNVPYLVSKRPFYGKDNSKKDDMQFNFERLESEGTIKMLELAPFIYISFTKGVPLIIDEFDARLHPLLSRHIIELFHSEDNKNNSQIIFTSHDNHLMNPNWLRPDQIVLVDKDERGASEITSLNQYEDVMEKFDYMDDYMKGKYGGVPLLKELFIQENDGQKEKETETAEK